MYRADFCGKCVRSDAQETGKISFWSGAAAKKHGALGPNNSAGVNII